MQVPSTSTLEADELGFQEEGVSYSFREILDMLESTPDIILTLPTDQIPELRAGLAARKAKDTQKLSKAGIKADPLSLSFLVYPALSEDLEPIEGMSCCRVRLAPRKGVMIASIKIPDNTL